MSGISVVIPAKDRAGVIERAIQSALAQTLAPCEIIVVDDGSSDVTAERVLAVAASAPSVKLIRRGSSGGAPVARNAGAAAASGDFIAFLDSDDTWLPTKLERQMALLDADPSAAAAFTLVTYNYRNRPPRYSSTKATVQRHDLLFANVLGGTSSALVRKALFERVGGFRVGLSACQDWDLWLRLADHGPMLVVPEALTQYFYDGGGRITKNVDNVLEGHAHIFQTIYDEVEDKRLLKRLRAAHLACYADIFSRHYFLPKRALGYAAAAFGEEPNLARFGHILRVAARIPLYAFY